MRQSSSASRFSPRLSQATRGSFNERAPVGGRSRNHHSRIIWLPIFRDFDGADIGEDIGGDAVWHLMGGLVTPVRPRQGLMPRTLPQEPARKGADTESGQLTFNNACRTCHTTKEGDNRLGPNLHNIIGRKAGSLPNYGYSSAMKGADFVWDKEKLDRFIAKPDEVVLGNNMKPHGVTSARLCHVPDP